MALYQPRGCDCVSKISNGGFVHDEWGEIISYFNGLVSEEPAKTLNTGLLAPSGLPIYRVQMKPEGMGFLSEITDVNPDTDYYYEVREEEEEDA